MDRRVRTIIRRTTTTSRPTNRTKAPLNRARRSYSTNGRTPIRLAICGGGPAGFYAAKALLNQQSSLTRPISIDLFEALPTPYGLSRYGVAPDHPEVKNCEHKFDQVGRHPQFRYFGNTIVLGDEQEAPSWGRASVRLSTLRAQYDLVLLAYGAGEERSLGGLEGENSLANIFPARTIVSWYNGYPSSPITTKPPTATTTAKKFGVDLSKIETVTIIGMGNVSLDIARILLSDVDVLRRTDISDEALSELARSRVRHVEIVGRRGPLQTAFTTRELRELVRLPDLNMHIDSPPLVDAVARIAEPGALARMPNGRLTKRLLEVMLNAAKQPPSSSSSATSRTCSLRFLQSPIAFHGAPSSSSDDEIPQENVGSVQWALNRLEYPTDSRLPPPDYSALKARPIMPLVTHSSPTDLVLKSLGSVPLLFPPLTPDPSHSRARNVAGRVVGADDQIVPGLYVTGWLSTGSKGVIGDTMSGATAVSETIVGDILSSSARSGMDSQSGEDFQPTLEGKAFCVDWQKWMRIDQFERDRARATARPRVKCSDLHQMLVVAGVL